MNPWDAIVARTDREAEAAFEWTLVEGTSVVKRAMGWTSILLCIIGAVAWWELSGRRSDPESSLRSPDSSTTESLDPASRIALEPATAPLTVSAVESPGTPNLLRGRVLDIHNEPLAEATVLVRCAECPGVESSQSIPELTTDVEGHFEVEELPPRAYDVFASRFSHRGEGLRVRVPTDEELIFRLHPAPHLVGTLYFETRAQPLRGEPFGVSWSTDSNYKPSDSTLRTDEEGHYQVGPIPEGVQWVTFFHEGNSPVMSELRFEEDGPLEHDVFFTRGPTAYGWVRTAQGIPVPRLKMEWRPENSPLSAILTTASDAEGRFEVRSLQEAIYHVELDFAGAQEARSRIVAISNEPLQEVVIIVECNPGIVLRLVDEAGAPMAGLEPVYGFELPGIGAQRTLEPTDADGRTRLPCITPGTIISLEVNDVEHGCVKASHEVSGAAELVELEVPAWRVLRGRVLTEEGAPAAGASLRVTPSETVEERFVRRYYATANASGAFEVKVPIGIHDVEARLGQAGLAMARSLDVTGSFAPPPLELRLGTDTGIRVRALDPEESPLQGFVVCASTPGARGALDEQQTDADGWAVLSVFDRAVDVTVRCPFPTDMQEFKGIQPGGPPIVAVFEPMDRTLSGIVLKDNIPVPVVSVGYTRWKGGLFGEVSRGVCTTDTEGRFRLKTIDGDRVAILAWAPSFALARSSWIDLPRRGEVAGVQVIALDGKDFHGELLDPEGKPVVGATLSVSVNGNPDDTSTTNGPGHPFMVAVRSDAQGVATIRALPLGDYALFAITEDRKLGLSRRLFWTGAGPLKLTMERQ